MPDPAATLKLPLIGILAWLIPGAGHYAIGEHRRGIIIFATIAATFWGGVAIGGVRTTVYPEKKSLWFMGQLCGGGHALIAYAIGESSRDRLLAQNLTSSQARSMSPVQLAELTGNLVATSQWGSAEIATVYTGVAGLLNILVILDALVRGDAPHQRRIRRARSPAGAIP
ncbi:MAG: hypothetical protein HOP29_04785 [Phycisphaerales bacterium]|nr:hypothetical protein [Phycisphaerales bacterium]